MIQKLNVTKEELYDLFITQNKTRDEIAEIFCVKWPVVKYWLSKYGIQKPKQLRGALSSKTQKKRYAEKKYRRFNNGVVETYATECPVGFVPGALESTKRKQSEALKGRKHSMEWNRKVSEAQKGKKISEERRRKITEFMRTKHPLKGTHRSKEVKDALVRANIKTDEAKKDEFFDAEFWKKNFVEDGRFLDRRKARDYFGLCFKVIGKQVERLGLDVVNKKYDYNSSRLEDELRDFVLSLGVDIVPGYRLKIENPSDYDDNSMWYELDIMIPSKNIAIEFNGCYYHAYPRKNKNYHLNKRLECEKHGIRLIQVWECDWLDGKTREKIERFIKSLVVYGEEPVIDGLGGTEISEKGARLDLDYYSGIGKENIEPQVILVTRYFNRTLNVGEAQYRCYNSGFSVL